MDESTLGKRVRLWRTQRGLDQGDLRAGIKQHTGITVGANYISELEGDKKKNPNVRVVAGIAKTLDVSLDYFGMLIDDARPIDYMAEPEYLSPEADEIATHIDSLAAPHRGAILEFIRAMATVEKARTQADSAARSLSGNDSKCAI